MLTDNYFLQAPAKKINLLTYIHNAHLQPMTNNLIPQTDEEWNPIIDALQTYTRQLVKTKTWFRGKQTEAYLGGKEINDYIYDAIGRFLQSPEKFDPEKGSLIEYLEFNIIRTLVVNDSRKAENKTSVDVFGKADKLNEENEDGNNYLDATLPYAEAFFDQQIDYDQVMKFIEEKVKSDPDVETLFYGFSLGMKRESILTEFNMSEKDYMNAYRRYKTVKKLAIAEFDIKEYKV
jgi:hypothetical protein